MGRLAEDATLGMGHAAEGLEDTAHRDQVVDKLEGVVLLVAATDHLEVTMVHPTMVDMAQVLGAGGKGVEVVTAAIAAILDGMARAHLVATMEVPTKDLLVVMVMVSILTTLSKTLAVKRFYCLYNL